VEARQKLPYWQACELDPNVWNNHLWGTSTPEWMDDTSLDSDSEFETVMSSREKCHINERRDKKA
jgi:hypothetical protein